MGLDSGEALVAAPALQELRDRLYVLESALRDVETDLRGDPALEEYRAAFRHLYAAVAPLRGGAPEPQSTRAPLPRRKIVLGFSCLRVRRDDRR